MPTRTISLAILLLLAACAAPQQETGPAEPPPRAERPTYALGEKWLLDLGAYELIRIEDDCYIFSAGEGKEFHLTKDLAIARFQSGDYFVEFIPPPNISWPLEVGKHGVVTGRVTGSENASGEFAPFLWGVDAYEEVWVPAGHSRHSGLAIGFGQAQGCTKQPSRSGTPRRSGGSSRSGM